MLALLLTSAAVSFNANLNASMTCGSGVNVCGVLTLESGMGSGVYKHPKPSVHGLWPEVGSFGTSSCVAPTGSTASPTKIYPCYKDANGGQASSIVTFEAHEWTKHGVCAGVKDVDDFFGQICGLAEKPISLMSSASNFSTMQTALKGAGFEIFSVDTQNEQLELSACLDSSGKWKLTPVSSFASECGGSAPGPSPTPGPAPTDKCVHDKHGPPCKSDSDCAHITDCVRCAKSGFCTDQPLS